MATILRGYGWESGQVMVQTADLYNSSTIASTSEKKTGAYSMKVASGVAATGWARFALAVANPSVSYWVYLSGSYGVNGTETRGTSTRFTLSTGERIDLRWNGTTHTYDVYVDNVLTASGTIEVSVNTWFHVQFYVVIGVGATGYIYVKINGHESIAYNGDTAPGGAATATYVYLAGESVYYDDLVIGYGGYLGDLRCPDIRPNADTAQDDWTPSAGDNYSTVDEISTTPATIDADYNKAGLNGDADELALGDFDGATYVPVAVTAWCRAQQLAANGDSIKIGIDSGGTDDVTEWPLSNTMEYYFHTADDNPADAAEWEDADIDALLVRYEAVIV